MAKGKSSVKSYVGRGRSGGGITISRVGPKALADKRNEIRNRISHAAEGLGPHSLRALQDLTGLSALQEDYGDTDNMYIDEEHAGSGNESDGNVEEELQGQGTQESLRIQEDMAVFVANRNFHRYRTGQYHQRLDGRTWKHRICRLNKNWQPLIPALIDAYTTWKYSPPPHIVTYTDPDASPLVDGRDFDIHDLARVAVIPCGENDEGAVALVRAGYLGCTPQRPSLAISLRMLELFYTIRMFRPSFSIEAFTKVVCHVHSVTYRRGYRSAISDAFDTYIIIRRHLDSRVAHELGQDTQNYRVLNSCPPCNYELKDEPPLKFSRMFVLDGNNSLKRMQGAGNRQVADDRVYQDSDYFLPEEYVNQFGNEVPRGRTQIEDEDAEELGLEQGGDPTDGHGGAFRIQEPEDFEQLPPHSSYSSGLSETRKTETRRCFLGEKRDNVLWEILQMESQMDVRRRWTPLDSEYKAALKYMTERKYLQALENLHLLVIKRLFEMHKLNMSGTGYKMRTHIAQALQRRAKAIRNAVNKYNKHALMLDPPRDTLDWTKVTHFSFIDQAREEIHRVNIELRHLHTRIVDEEKLFASTLEHLRGSLMLGPVLEYVTRRREVNKLLISRINATYNLPGFTGTPYPGESINPVHATYLHTPSASEMHEPDTSPPTSPGHNAGSSNVPHSTPDDRQPQFEDDNSEDEGPLEDDDEFVDDMGKVIDFIAGL
ncbi:hypothetical protein C8J55DRAFT_556601 [Lentinula edodes]|uniref:CxC1-like cysteine cluster associated with KDZ transposases domain-containing protein n=1 Tax=Lentinula lateritia TaxID=40482 RepID=A0A9W9DYI0_9AGAR|nr:hypothetical protein C8J55DRAFT_556601 [Lentinula edodes]